MCSIFSLPSNECLGHQPISSRQNLAYGIRAYEKVSKIPFFRSIVDSPPGQFSLFFLPQICLEQVFLPAGENSCQVRLLRHKWNILQLRVVSISLTQGLLPIVLFRAFTSFCTVSLAQQKELGFMWAQQDAERLRRFNRSLNNADHKRPH